MDQPTPPVTYISTTVEISLLLALGVDLITYAVSRIRKPGSFTTHKKYLNWGLISAGLIAFANAAIACLAEYGTTNDLLAQAKKKSRLF